MSSDQSESTESTEPAITVFERAGGQPAFRALIDEFYARVETDEVLRAQYPEDLGPGKDHLARFFGQYWGGGPIYSADRGHPRLRLRHAGFHIDPDMATRWATHMIAAIHEMDFPDEVTGALLEYVAKATPTLINQMPPLVERG